MRKRSIILVGKKRKRKESTAGLVYVGGGRHGSSETDAHRAATITADAAGEELIRASPADSL
jgi:hypothetical protein